VKFTDRGHVLIAAECVPAAGNGGNFDVKVSITDTGIGIPSEKLESLFEKFTQADTSTTRKYGGTGLGLAISKTLAELLGGSLHVDSEAGRGSMFCFSLRLPLDSEPYPAPVPAASLRGLRVLIVDDNEVNRRVIHEQISHWGMRNGSYSSGEEALTAIRTARTGGDPYDIVIADFQMPGMDGAALAASIKADADLRGIVFVLLTSVGLGREPRRLEGVSVDACLVKPVRHEKLMHTLATAWSR
jgi:CheY-like chemotaxis protein